MIYFSWFSRTAFWALGAGWFGFASCHGYQAAASLATPVINEQFDQLDLWRALEFPLQTNSEYHVSGGLLYADCDDSVSALVLDRRFKPRDNPMLEWRWEVDNVFAKGDALSQDGDDFPLRVSVCFKFDPKKVSGNERRWFKMQKLVWGEYPPYRVLHYVFASRGDLPGRYLPCPYSERARIVVQRAGQADIGQWHEEHVDIMTDYRAAFGEEPPAEAVISVMADSDNTREASAARLDWIRVSPRLP